MTKINPNVNIDDDFDPEVYLSRHKAGGNSALRSNRSEHALNDEVLRYHGVEELPDEEAFSPTYQGSRFEREWILDYLGNFFDQHLLTDVLQRVKGGKEANVYACQADPATGMDMLAAKIYRPRMLRNLRNDARYRQGRDYLDEFGKTIKDHRMLVAIQKGTGIGKVAVHTSWLEHEYHTLEMLFEAGVRVPRPVAVGSNTILMEYIGNREMPAPTLREVRLTVREARQVYERLLDDLDHMLAAGRVHGDLSAYNVLYWQGEGRIIDLPQAIDPLQNPDAWDIFQRDVTRLCQYFQRYGLGERPLQLARNLWQRYNYPWGPEAPLPDEDEDEDTDE